MSATSSLGHSESPLSQFSDDEEEGACRREQEHAEDTPLLVGSLGSYGFYVGEPIIPEDEVSEHPQIQMIMDTTAMIAERTTTTSNLEDGPSLPRNDSFLSTSTALTEVSQYDLDTGTRFASMERKVRFRNPSGMSTTVGGIDDISRYSRPTPLRPYNRNFRDNSDTSFLKKSRSTPHMGVHFEAPSQKNGPQVSLEANGGTSTKDPRIPMNEEDEVEKMKEKPAWYNNKLIMAIVLVISVAVVTTAVISIWKGRQQEGMDVDDEVPVDDVSQQRKLVFTVSLSATVKLLAAVGIGAIAASKKPSPKASHVILDQVAVSALSRLVFWVFQPCFFLCRVAMTIAATTRHGSAEGISRSSLALMPLVALVNIALGSCSAKFITFFSHRTNDSMSYEEKTMVEDSKRDAEVCMTFANSAPLPLLFANALFTGGQGGVEADVTACISFYLLGWSPTFWSYGRHLIGTYDDDSDEMDGPPGRNTWERVWDGMKEFGEQVRKVFAPPIIGSTIGIFIGAIPWLRDSMLEPDGILYSLYGAMDTIGSAYLPSVILVLAGSLVGGSKKGGKQPRTPKSTSLNITTLISILLSRFALAPVASIVVVYVLTHVNLLPPVGTRSHAIVSFVMLMEGCMPPAQNSILMLQLEGLTARAENMARGVTLIYVLSVLPVTIWLMCMMGMSGVMEFR